jgi:uncharacterized membrane protein
VVQPVALLATIASAVLGRRERPSFWFLVAASVALLIAGLITRLVNVPINFEIQRWEPGAVPSTFLELQERWWTFHVVRCVGLGLGLCSLVLGVLSRDRQSSSD